jgi:uncharacterized protein (DUF1778 family)
MAQTATKKPSARVRSERLEARVTPYQKGLIERAAALQGRSVTDFVLSSVQDAAQRAIDDYQRIDLSVKDAEAFVEALLNPQPVNDRLRETIRRYVGRPVFEESGERANVVALDASHDRSSFESGVEPLDRYFRTQIGQGCSQRDGRAIRPAATRWYDRWILYPVRHRCKRG